MTIEQGLVAKFSPDRKYRYLLTRRVGLTDDAVTFVMPKPVDGGQREGPITRTVATPPGPRNGPTPWGARPRPPPETQRE